MTRSFSARFFLVSAFAAIAGQAVAQSAAPADPNTQAALTAAPAPAARAPGVSNPPAKKADDRQITDSDIANALTDGMPKYDPTKPDANTPPPDSSDAAKPKNDIVRLPKYVVTERKPPVFTEHNSYTKKGLEELAIKRYLGDFDSKILNRWYIPFLTASPGERALQMYREDERLANMKDLNDEAAAITRAGDPAEGAYIKKATQDTYMRSMDWGSGAKGSLGLGADLGY